MRYFIGFFLGGSLFVSQTLWADVSDERLRSLENHINDLEQEIRDLVGRIERAEHQLKLSSQSPSSETSLSSSPSREEKEELPTANNPQELDAYNNALDLLKAKKFPEAKIAFQTFLQDHPKSPFRSLAHYWTAVIYYIEKDYSTALERFNQFRTLFPKSSKKYDVLMKISSCHHEEGNKEKACEVLRQCITELDQDPQKETLTGVHQRIQSLQNKLQCFAHETAA
ncbi:MAG: tetratricopeptide repeat protein [Holosporales bacterium]|nr:tetratricopeptide repeat protein [Holosporales bacterium]